MFQPISATKEWPKVSALLKELTQPGLEVNNVTNIMIRLMLASGMSRSHENVPFSFNVLKKEFAKTTPPLFAAMAKFLLEKPAPELSMLLKQKPLKVTMDK